jgi:hypothetical protein
VMGSIVVAHDQSAIGALVMIGIAQLDHLLFLDSNCFSELGIVSFGLKMTRDRFTLFQRLCFKRSAKGRKKGF